MNGLTLLGPNRGRRLSLLVALLVLAALTSACTFEVQPIEKYTSPDGYLSFTFPAAWDVLEEESGQGATAAFLGTRDDFIDLEVVPPGEAGVVLMLIPNTVPGPDGEPVPLTAQELAAFSQQTAAAQQPEVTDVQSVLLDSGLEAFTYTARSPQADMTMHVFSPDGESLAVVAFIFASGEQDPARLAEAAAILNSVDVSEEPKDFGEGPEAVLRGGE